MKSSRGRLEEGKERRGGMEDGRTLSSDTSCISDDSIRYVNDSVALGRTMR